MKEVVDQKKQTVLIRTPDHHLRVFVSSTLRELEEERKAVRQAITGLHLSPVMFESGARPHPAQDVYQAYLSQSHVFIGIYWQSYGWVAPEMQVSGLEDEYNRSAGIPRLIYIKNPSPERDPALTRMLGRIRDDNASSYKYFETTQELKELVKDDLILLLTEYFETAHAMERPPDVFAPASFTNVPIPRNPLIGRELELGTACSLLMREDVALVTLTGPAGTGKSRLGIQIALELRDKFNDGVYLVPLESIRNPKLVIPAIASTLNITEKATGVSLLDQLKGLLCDKQLLLFLDNFEQILQAAPRVAELLEACPYVKILVTSRASLHLRPEKELPIPPLAVPPLLKAPELQSLTQYSAVQLFIQRCQAVKGDFQVTHENAPAIAEICFRLDGLPLAIELAAARIKLLPPQALLSRLEHRFEVLRADSKDLPERQRTMYSAIDWSYSLMDENDRRLFQSLSVFCGGWTVDAACVVCDADNQGQVEILDGLQRLVDNNLVISPEMAGGEPRLKMLESIREFASEHLNLNTDSASVYERYVQYFLSFAQQAETGLQGSSQEVWHKKVESELCNLRGVMDWALEQKKCEITLQIAICLWRFWWTHGYWKEGFHWLNTALEGAHDIPVILKATALTQVSWFHRNFGDFPKAIAILQESLALWHQIDDQNGLALTLNHMGASLLRLGDIEGARLYLEEALNLYQQHGNKVGMYSTLEILGHAAAKLGDKNAIELYKQALSLAEEVQDDDQIAKFLCNIGDEYVSIGNYEQAEDYFNQAEAICKKQGNRIVGAYVSGNRSLIAIKRADYPEAFDLLVETIQVLQESGAKEDTILCLEPIAYIARELGQPDRATKLLGASETQRKLIGMTRAKPIQDDYDKNITELSRQLGEALFKAALTEGSRMTLDQAVAYAVQWKI